MSKLPVAMFTPSELAPKVQMEVLLSKLESLTNLSVLGDTLDETLAELTRYLGPDKSRWQWLRANNLTFQHPLNKPEWNRGPFARGGDSFTIDAAGGARAQSAGASYREVIDLSDWDKSTMTNVPGEVGDPTSPHYSDLLDDWLKGRYHPMPFSRKAVEAVTTERITLTP
jgi:penicillin G amidase